MKTIINKITCVLFICFFATISIYAQTSEDEVTPAILTDRLFEVYQSSLRGFMGWRSTDDVGGLHISSASSKSKMIFSIGASVDSDQNNEFMRLYRDGDVGILQIGNPKKNTSRDIIRSVHNLAFQPNSATRTILYLGQNYVGIGTENPQRTFDVSGDARIKPGNDELVISQRGDGNLQVGNGENRDWYLSSNGNGVVKITSTGNVVFLSNKSAAWPTISTANLSKYDIFADRGVLAADFAIGPTSSWADYVLAGDYILPALSEIEIYIKENGKLPDIPSAGEVAEDGYSLHEMNVQLLKKIEELTLHLIRQDKEIAELKSVLVK